ncbi:MAG: hypothetical protein GX883_01625, partial [Firmicutes bacterium]|nr:hypothetical protein [Bacillota bacterium]
MAKIYAPNEAHNVEHGVTFINGVAMVPDANTELIARFEARGYAVVPGDDALLLWDQWPVELLRMVGPLCGIDPVGMAKQELVVGIETALTELMKITIEKFDDINTEEIANNEIDGGDKNNPTYDIASKVIDVLPQVITATLGEGVRAVIPVEEWLETDTYTPG